MNKRQKLRALMADKNNPVLLSGAHDAISARLAENAGFQAIWASGFGISLAQKAVPDANLMTMTENLEFASYMDEAVNLPIIADCDNGFGNAINLIRTVKEYEKNGIAGICIEDNIFPKRCSFYEDVYRGLESIEEFTGKIRAAKDAQRTEDFVLIARSEALIAGLEMEEAVERAYAYAEAGADAVLVHSKQKTFEQLQRFAKYWDSRVPLVIVPTTFPQTPISTMHQAGYQILIYANQAVRASILAIKETLGEIIKQQNAECVTKQISSLSDVFELIEVEKLQKLEQRYLVTNKVAQL